ncbi:MAG: hypothetical protein IJU14_04040 [Clostridia bacterium]|nr:hypothetical protein [Clostridia bacterium]
MFSKITEQVLNFAVRTVFVFLMSVEYLGINGLFVNILSFLSLAELGTGSAMLYLLYKPVAENNIPQIQIYMHTYRNIYRIIGCVVLVIGLALMPFLSFFIADMPDIPESLEVIYLLYIVRTVSTYFFAYKQSVFLAYQQGYVVTLNNTLFTVIRSVLEIGILYFSRNFMLYLVISVIVNYAMNIRIFIKADKCFPYLREKVNGHISVFEKQHIRKNIGAMFLHKVGLVVLNSSDNLILSKFIGIITVGIYSNYAIILTVVKTMLWTVFDAVVPSVGNLCAEKNNVQKYKVFRSVQFVNLWLSGFCAVSLGVLANPFIMLWIGKDYLLSQNTVTVIIISYYLQTNMRAIEMFRSATGLFYNDRYVPLIQCVINIVVSVIGVYFFGVAGIFIGTSLSILLTGFWVQPFMVFRHIFRKPLYLYFWQYLRCTIISVISFVGIQYLCRFLPDSGIIVFLIKILCCLVIPNGLFVVVFCRTEEFRFLTNKVKQIFPFIR